MFFWRLLIPHSYLLPGDTGLYNRKLRIWRRISLLLIKCTTPSCTSASPTMKIACTSCKTTTFIYCTIAIGNLRRGNSAVNVRSQSFLYTYPFVRKIFDVSRKNVQLQRYRSGTCHKSFRLSFQNPPSDIMLLERPRFPLITTVILCRFTDISDMYQSELRAD